MCLANTRSERTHDTGQEILHYKQEQIQLPSTGEHQEGQPFEQEKARQKNAIVMNGAIQA